MDETNSLPDESNTAMNENNPVVDETKCFADFITLYEPQLSASGVPEEYWPTINHKFMHSIYDAGKVFKILKLERNNRSPDEVKLYDFKVVVINKEGISVSDKTQVYIIDHGWIYEANKAKDILKTVPGLPERMLSILGLKDEANIDDILPRLWTVNQTYSLGAGPVEDRMPLWYIMDELGSAIQHSDEPNFRAVPFFNFNEGTSFSLLYPLKDVDFEEEATRDYADGTTDPELRNALLLPWRSRSYKEVDFKNIELDEDYFYRGAYTDSIPVDCKQNPIDPDKVWKVYSEYEYITEYLTHPKFEVVTSEEEADILCYLTHFNDYEHLSAKHPEKLINQFPFENVITVKDLLCYICRHWASATNTRFDWIPTTYNLKVELPQFISYYQNREEKKLNNIWICKPFNLARGLDMCVTDDINCIIRVSSTGPKIVQKYIEDPVLFVREGVGSVKFDVRYVLMLKSSHPLEAYVYRNFFLRFANKPFELKDFDDYEKHFTVMNYTETVLYKMLCHDFILEFEKQNPKYTWNDVESKIFKMFKSVMLAATSRDPPFGIPKSVQSRAVYAADLILCHENGTILPKLLEINWAPDCQRACEYYPNFYNDIFSLLYLNTEVCTITRL